MVKPYPTLLAALALCACTSTWESETPRFAVHPYGVVDQPAKRESQEGSGIGPVLSQTEFVEVSIAQGSGLDGFDAIRVFGDGAAYAFFGRPKVGASNEKRNSACLQTNSPA
jgi:hypothetical protein